MPKLFEFTVEVTKTIVMTLEAATKEEAIAAASDTNEGWDNAWNRCTPITKIIEIK